MNISFEGKVALVTGAASGLGLATAKAFAESGASVALADWNEKAARAAADELTAQGHKAIAIRCDVADDAQVEAMVKQTVAAFGGLDAAYNNAGVQNVLAETADTTREDYDRVMGINLRGEWSCMKFELQQMRKQGSGAIVNCSSLGGACGRRRTRYLPRRQARRPWVHQKRGSRICGTRHPDQCDMPWAHLDTDDRPDGRGRSGRCSQGNGEERAYGTGRSPRGNCERGSVALQRRCQLRDWPVDFGGRRFRHALKTMRRTGARS
jgi:NAD(P)-dependent dehydrogenase (short-subunit alcohol dehydrogenase family)